MKKKLLFTFLTIVPLLTACTFAFKEDSKEPGGGKEPDKDEPVIPAPTYNDPYIGVNPALKNSEGYLEFWNETSNVAISITMSKEAANFMNQYQTTGGDSTYFDYYVPCTTVITLNGVTTTYEEVGIRVKGNTSRIKFLDNGAFTLSKRAHFKLKFNETFDDEEYDEINALKQFKKTWNDDTERKERKNRTLYDMEKIDIKWNRNDDATKSRQGYMLKQFRENGVLAGRHNLFQASLQVEGTEPMLDTYEAMECIDEIFISRYFAEQYADGDLYKCCYQNAPANFSDKYTIGNQIGVEDNTINYHPAYDLKTNKKKNKTHTNLFNLIEVMNDRKSSAEEWKNKIEPIFNMQNFLKYEAIAAIFGNFDDFRNNMNNYYLYFTSETNYAYIIPYDFDRGLGCGCLGIKNYMTDFSIESTKMQCTGNWQESLIYWRTICSNNSYNSDIEKYQPYGEKYRENIEDLLNNKIISTESFTNYVNSFPNEYRGDANGSGNGNCTFDHYLNLKKDAIRTISQFDIK